MVDTRRPGANRRAVGVDRDELGRDRTPFLSRQLGTNTPALPNGIAERPGFATEPPQPSATDDAEAPPPARNRQLQVAGESPLETGIGGRHRWDLDPSVRISRFGVLRPASPRRFGRCTIPSAACLTSWPGLPRPTCASGLAECSSITTGSLLEA